MNERQREVQLSLLGDEQEYIRRLKETYKQASKDCENKISQLSARTDLENIQSIIYQKQYQEILKKQIDEALANLQSNEYLSMNDYLENCYKNSFTGTLYDLHGQGVPLLFPIDQSQVAKAVQLDSKISEGLYTRLGEDISKLKENIRSEVSRGIANGSTWNQTASNLAMGMKSPLNKAYNNAVRIARTEGHRIQNQAQTNTLNKAKAKGADVVKQWDSTLDDKTRDSHKALDGQIREIDEPFEVNGLTAMQPGGFGNPAEDCNCRCCMLQRAKWALDESELKELQERAEYFGLDKSESFEDFKKKYLNAVNNSGIIDENISFRQFDSGDDVNNFFRYDDERRGLKARQNSEHGQWVRSLSDDEKESILDYTRDGYGDINDYWRKKEGWEYINSDAVKEESKHIDDAISRYTLKDNIVVQRGAMEDVLDQLFENYETSDDYSGWIGKKYVEQGYMSTTVLNNNPVATAKPVVFNIQVPAGKGVGAYINEPSLTGFCDTEYEFLIKRNSTFTITGVKEDIQTGEFIVDMRLDV